MDSFTLIKKLVEENKCMQENVLDFLEAKDACFKNVKEYIDNEKIRENKEKLLIFINILSTISDNHKISHEFINKIKQIINYLQLNIKKFNSDLEIYQTFKKSKQILLFLFDQKILIPNSLIFEDMRRSTDMLQYFYREFESFILEMKNPPACIINKEEGKCGDNTDMLCEIIRQDQVKEFSIFINTYNIPLSYEIDGTIYEKNSFLSNKKVTLIEYAAFHGSTNIFKDLMTMKVTIDPSILLYAIHSNNDELVDFILQNVFVKIDQKTSNLCLLESIKCHHIQIMKFFKEYHFQDDGKINLPRQCLKNYNFILLNDMLSEMKCYDDIDSYFKREDKNLILFLCKYKLFSFVKVLLEYNRNLNINEKIIKISYISFY
ncbi:hypothetical protein M9Y10_000620 [Tritrichomonas musculus]|uniref:DUF3447 domain-containing protein n=1 Tax=Tritrichomonas musculus TaxID=1915356 RepID=A0ABR2L5R8_9EUKA